MASQQLSPGHVVMTVPQQVLMSAMSARQDPVLSEALRQHPEQLTSHQVTSRHLPTNSERGASRNLSIWSCLLLAESRARTHDCAPALSHRLHICICAPGCMLLCLHAQVLALHLIHEASKGPASKWHAYIQQLPRTYTTFLNWGPAAVQELQLPYAQAVAAKAVQGARQDWTSARPVLQHLGEL